MNASLETLDEGNAMERGLTNRHVQFIAIGGAIGTGLFLGSSSGSLSSGRSPSGSCLLRSGSSPLPGPCFPDAAFPQGQYGLYHMAADASGRAGALALSQREAHCHRLLAYLYPGLFFRTDNLRSRLFLILICTLYDSFIADADKIVVIYPGQPLSPLIHMNLLYINIVIPVFPHVKPHCVKKRVKKRQM